jgi:L-aminopeptidase/D-esterase-like protein
VRPGPTNSLTDIAGLRVGHATRREPGWLTGTTVVLTPPGGVMCGVDVRGGSPGTRETDLLDPPNLVDRVDAVMLGGGSALGLAAADGVVAALLAEGRGWPAGGPGEVVPIVPATILFDLGRGGVWGNYPGAAEGAAAFHAASAGPVPQGVVGAGTGARSSGLKGGIGSASVVLDDGTTVAALVTVNSAGSPVDPRTGELWAVRYGLEGEFAEVGPPAESDVAAYRGTLDPRQAASLNPGQATTIGVLATDASLSKAQCQKLAGLGHDGMARAINPVHTMVDGDSLFMLATGDRPEPDPTGLFLLMQAAGDCVTRAIAHGLLAAESVDGTAHGGVAIRSYLDTFPSASLR